MKIEKIYDTKNKDILIFDWNIGRVLKYLEDNRISHKPQKAYKYGTTQWVFVNLDRMTYTRGVGGIQTGSPLKHHAIRFDEFKFIFGVYEEFGEGKALDEAVEHVYAKYEGKEIFTFHSERFDLEKPKEWIEPQQREKKYINMHKDVIKYDD